MANIAQLVRAPGCGSGGRGFNSHYSPQNYLNTLHSIEKVAYFYLVGLHIRQRLNICAKFVKSISKIFVATID